MKIIYMGTPEFAVPALKGLIGSAHEVVAVYSQPPRPAGRGQKLRKSPVHELAEANGIPVLTPEKLLQEDTHPKADIAVVAAYGLLLPEWFLQSFTYGCINIHPSALPRWRGAAPIQRTVMAGDETTDICIMQMEKGLDTGPVLKRETYKVPPRATSGELHDMLAEKSVELLLGTLDNIQSLIPNPRTASPMRRKSTRRKRKSTGINPPMRSTGWCVVSTHFQARILNIRVSGLRCGRRK